MKSKQFIRLLKKHGVEFVKDRGKGGHLLARYKGKQTTIPVHGDSDLGSQFIKLVCKQLNIDPKQII